MARRNRRIFTSTGVTFGYHEGCSPQAGVSTSTVSHVINKDRFVSEAITAKVDAAIKALTMRRLRWRAASN
jgi:hypothetical protein